MGQQRVKGSQGIEQALEEIETLDQVLEETEGLGRIDYIRFRFPGIRMASKRSLGRSRTRRDKEEKEGGRGLCKG